MRKLSCYINRKDQGLDIIMRIYQPDLEKMKTWQTPKAEKLRRSFAERSKSPTRP